MTPPREPFFKKSEFVDYILIDQANRFVELLQEENEQLRAELVEVYRKLSILHAEIEQAPLVYCRNSDEYGDWECDEAGALHTRYTHTARLLRPEEIKK